MAEKLSPTAAIKKYLERSDSLCVGASGRPIGMDEFKALSAQERKELGELAAKELGAEIQA